MISVSFTEAATAYLNELVEILLKEEYFSFKATADEYVDDLVNFIVTKIGTVPRRIAPLAFKKFGQDLQYIKYKRNKHTVWYIFFIQKGDRFLITHITNNHIASQFLKGL